MTGGAARRWAWALVLVVGVLLFESVREALVATGNEALGPTLVLLGALVIPASFVTFVAGRGIPVRVDPATLALLALGSGVIGVVLAGVIEFETLQRLGAAGKVGVAVIEETAKLIVPAALMWRRHSYRVGDALLIGVASGAGFAALETMGYAFTTVVNDHGNLATVSNLLLVRGLWSPAGHMAWTGIAAAAFGAAVGQRFSARSCGIFVASFGLTVTLHAAWDWLQTPWAYAAIAVTGLGALAFIVHRLVASTTRLTSRPS